jgi:hypothetical protein
VTGITPAKTLPSLLSFEIITPNALKTSLHHSDKPAMIKMSSSASLPCLKLTSSPAQFLKSLLLPLTPTASPKQIGTGYSLPFSMTLSRKKI